MSHPGHRKLLDAAWGDVSEAAFFDELSGCGAAEVKYRGLDGTTAVSYTHLTLPTKA